MSSNLNKIVVVGASHAGVSVAGLLRQEGYTGSITLISDDAEVPYQRPPLSKTLSGEATEFETLVPLEFYGEQNIDLRLGVRAQSLSRTERAVELSDGTTIAYDAVVLATGARARRLELPGSDLPGVYELRTAADAHLLRKDLKPDGRLTVIGGGWIGLELAAAATLAGLEVTVVEIAEQLLPRTASAPLSAFLRGRHLALGVKLLTGRRVVELGAGIGGTVAAITLEDGETIATDYVAVGVGSLANDELAREAGLECHQGVLVDPRGRTADPAVYALGDVAAAPDRAGVSRRLESIPGALAQARAVVSSILDAKDPEYDVPWFWSDQFDHRVQIAGIVPAGADTVVLTGDDPSRFVALHLADGQLHAIETVDAMQEFMQGKLAIRHQLKMTSQMVDTPGFSLTESVSPLLQQASSPYDVLDTVTTMDLVQSSTPARPGEPRVTYISQDGDHRTITAPAGQSVMAVAVRGNVPGIVGECGGLISRGTCHVYLDKKWRSQLEEMEPEELELLAFMPGFNEDSRLSCQIVMEDALDGIVVAVAENEI